MNWTDFFELHTVSRDLIFRFILNLLFATLLTRGVYYRAHKRTDLFLPFYSFNIIVFFVSFMLNRVELSTGAAFGLFAVFSILRYRTEGISAKDMTYLFLNIAIGLLSAVGAGSFGDVSLICLLILTVTYLLESKWVIKKESYKTIHYDNIELLHDSHQEALVNDLKKRTGLEITRYTINDIDFLKDTFSLTVYFIEK